MKQKRVKFASLDDVRQEKDRARRKVGQDVRMLRNHVEDCFAAPETFFLQSDNKYMNYVGYAITAYKMVGRVRSALHFFRGKK